MDIRGTGEKEGIPVVYNGGTISCPVITIDGSISSQFISALLIACPQLDHDTTIEIIGRELVSLDYLTMTRQILSLTGVTVRAKGPRSYRIDGRQKFKGLKKFEVPSDYGLAAFLMAAASVTKSDVTLTGAFHDNLVQADGRILGFLKKMDVKFTQKSGAIRIKGPFKLKGGTFSLKDCPDLVPIMATLALFAETPVRLMDIGHARAKESDRISDLRQELLKVGADISETSDELLIRPQPIESYQTNVTLDPHHDHRLAMAFSVLGLRHGVTVKNFECTHKSYPSFLRDIKALGARTKTL
jgi:3-phosphoshikimate 1-carboxyvinyltransferase